MFCFRVRKRIKGFTGREISDKFWRSETGSDNVALSRKGILEIAETAYD
jgi:hypothetical protein